MSATETHDPNRRDFLYIATGMAGAEASALAEESPAASAESTIILRKAGN